MSEDIGDEQSYSGTMKTENGFIHEVNRSKLMIMFVEIDNQRENVYRQ